jgi:hypothetical protein
MSYAVNNVSAASLANGQTTFRVLAQVGVDTTRALLWVSDSSNVVTIGSVQPPPRLLLPRRSNPRFWGLVQVQHARKKVASVTIAFNEAMVPGSVSSSALYSVLGGVPKRGRVVFSKRLKIRTIRYDRAGHTVSISLANPYRGQVELSLDGMIEATDGASSLSAFSGVVH